jgi:long-subunit fatty acid transport protein
MFLPHAKFLIIFLFLFATPALFAQTSSTSNPLADRENNPYSKYGIGELQNGNSTVLKGMGNLTSAFENPYEINSDNPASYAFLKRTTFEAGMTASTRNVNAAGTSYTTGTATLSYLTIGVPVDKNAGLCFGFKPYTHSFYSLVDTIFSPGSPIGETVRSYNGDGGLNYAYIGAAYQYKGFSIGANVGYMFGTITNNTEVASIDTVLTNKAYTANFANYNRIGGIYWKAGALWEHKLDSTYTLRIGGTFTLSQNITERLNAYQISVYNFGDTIVNDTSTYSGQSKGKLKLPMSYSIGAMLVSNGKWSIGADYTLTQWSGFNSSTDAAMNDFIAKSSYKVSLGGEYTPDANNIRSYYSKITYRFGVYYGTDYLTFQNTQLPVYGLTLGASLPFRRSFSHLHTSLDIGRLGTNTNNLIQETYVRFSLGMSFNDLWFIKRKYD